MKFRILYIFLLALTTLFAACSDDDTFTTSSNNLLTFSMDTVRLDTTFSKVPTATKTFWVYNRSGDGLRCANIRLKNGNQTGYRVNVDGVYLSKEQGYQVNDIEIRDKDSIRVFVELTSVKNGQLEPVKVEDDIIFTLESGVQQKMPLLAWSWDAEMWNNVIITEDQTIDSDKPIIIYGGLTVDKGATLTIAAGMTLYFHQDAKLNVKGRLISQGTAEKNVVLRGDRIDRMFDYLPYDRLPGQWQGIFFDEKSYDNEINYTDIHSAYNGIVCDSSSVEQHKLTLQNSVIHNCQGYGLLACRCAIDICNTQITNTLNDCVYIIGGKVTLKHCTLGQFYPFDADRGMAIRFSNYIKPYNYPLELLDVRNTIITGYADDVLMREANEKVTENFLFDHCLLRTPAPDKEDSRLTDNIFENVEDTVTTGWKNFYLMDTKKLIYDFRLNKVSKAISAGVLLPDVLYDRLGVLRGSQPCLGAYEYVAPKEEEEKKEE